MTAAAPFFAPAPPLQVAHWFNTPAPLTLDSLRGRVVVLHAFQMLCPGCVEHGIPQARRVHEAFAPDQLDRLNYLFAALKKQGLYISIDLFTIRKIDPQVIPEVAGKLSAISMTDYKMLLPVSDGAFADWQQFARAVLTTRSRHGVAASSMIASPVES